jgi:hypothetical protein
MSGPSAKGGNGRSADGRFTRGWKGGPGNPHARKVARIRSALLKASTAKNVAAIVQRLIDGAKAGDLAFIREFFDRTVGRAAPIDPMELEIRLNDPPAKPPSLDGFDYEAFAALWRAHWPEPEPEENDDERS